MRLPEPSQSPERIVFSNAAADRILGTGAAVEASPDEWASHYGVFLPDGETPFPTDRYPLMRAVDGALGGGRRADRARFCLELPTGDRG